MTEVAIGHAGVGIAFVGDEGADVTGEGFKHGNMVKHGERGVWVDPLDPGMYPINPKTDHVRFHLQPRRLADHPHPALFGAQG